jgi:hypothetical protein
MPDPAVVAGRSAATAAMSKAYFIAVLTLL